MRVRHVAAWGVAGLLSSCAPISVDDTDPLGAPDGWNVAVSTDPAPPAAGEAAAMTLRITENGQPVQDLQQSHERMVHTFVIAEDLSWFAHLHHEDFAPVTVENLANSTFEFPVTFPARGRYRLAFEYAARNAYRSDDGWVEVVGEPALAAAPDLTPVTSAVSGAVRAQLEWEQPPVEGMQAAFRVVLGTLDGEPVTDVVPWLGADAHVALARSDLSVVAHTHAYVAGMESAPPGHEMPHVYDGPEIPFRATFGTAGMWAAWVQVARADAPEAPADFLFKFEVSPN